MAQRRIPEDTGGNSSPPTELSRPVFTSDGGYKEGAIVDNRPVGGSKYGFARFGPVERIVTGSFANDRTVRPFGGGTFETGPRTLSASRTGAVLRSPVMRADVQQPTTTVPITASGYMSLSGKGPLDTMRAILFTRTDFETPRIASVVPVGLGESFSISTTVSPNERFVFSLAPEQRLAYRGYGEQLINAGGFVPMYSPSITASLQLRINGGEGGPYSFGYSSQEIFFDAASLITESFRPF